MNTSPFTYSGSVTEGEHHMQGANTYDVNLYDLSAGIYFVQLRISTNSAVQKLIKL